MENTRPHSQRFAKDHLAPKMGSNRSFGVTFAVVLVLIGFFPAVSGGAWSAWPFFLAVAVLGVAVTYPRLLSPLNAAWFRFGSILHRVMSPIVMGIVYWSTFVPIGLAFRVLRKDILRLRFDEKAASYWRPRMESGSDASNMTRQF